MVASITEVTRSGQFLIITSEDGDYKRQVILEDTITSKVITGDFRILQIYRDSAGDLYITYEDANGDEQTEQLIKVSGSPSSGEYARWASDGLEGVSVATLLTDIFANSMPENTLILLDQTIGTDGNYSGLGFKATAGAALSFGEVCYLASADSKWEKAQGDAEATTKPMTAVVCVAASEDATATFLLFGWIRNDSWNWTPGGALFIDPDTAGALTQTNLTTGEFQKCVGWAWDANTAVIVPNPDWVEVD